MVKTSRFTRPPIINCKATIIITNIPSGFNVSLEQKAIYGLMISHIPLMGIEGILTAMIISFMHRVMPELLPS